MTGLEAAVITTYRCQNRCYMCGIWRHPTRADEEFRPELLRKLPRLDFCNVTGGEPTLREDLPEIIEILLTQAKRVVISTNGYLTEKIVALAKQFKSQRLGFRISLEGLPAANDALRGIKDGFDHGLRTLLELQRLGLKDIGFGITVSGSNARDMIELYQLAKAMDVEFATAVVHNSYYFHKSDNKIEDPDETIACFKELIGELLKTWRPKNWLRAYFNHGLINYIRGKPRLLPCRAGSDLFFVDPWGEVRPCNGLASDSPESSFGNLREKTFSEIWHGPKAESILRQVRDCQRNCWMIGSAAPAIKSQPGRPILWVIRHKFLGEKLD